MKRKKIIKLLGKKYNSKISCLTSYSSSISSILDGNVDVILIGDSLGSTLYGFKNTRKVTLDMMKNHGQAVTKKIKNSLSIIDMPYKTYENKKQALDNVNSLLKATKANLVKLEITKTKLPIIKYLSEKKINLVAHIGVTPQSYENFEDIRVVGKTTEEKEKLYKLALGAELAGAKAILLECVSESCAKEITASLKIPTIGIGASKYCDGQVLVFDDLMGINTNKAPKFVKVYADLFTRSQKIVRKFNKEVKAGIFPSKKNTYK